MSVPPQHLEPSTLQEGPQQNDSRQQQEAFEQDHLAAQHATPQQRGSVEEQRPPRQLDTQPGQNVVSCEPLSLEQDVA